MGLGQILFGIYFAGLGAYLSIVLSRVLKQNGRVFNKIEESIRKMDEGFRYMNDRAEQRHQEVMMALDKGFGTLIQQRAI